jgi:hypothetical protein
VSDVPQPPIDQALNLTTQAVLLYGSWALTAVVLVVAIRMGARERTAFYPLLVLAAGVGAFVEPLYDTAMMLYFYSTSGMVTHFTALDIPQPLWTHSGYVVLYAVPALAITRHAWNGTLTAGRLYALAGLEMLMSCAFEMVAINGGTFAYWGPHTLRVLNYPLVIGVLETVQVVVFALAADALRRRVSHQAGLLGLFVLFPVTFLGANFGAGWPTIIAIHLDTPSAPIIFAGTLLSIVLSVLIIGAAAKVRPTASFASESVASTRPSTQVR